MPGKPSQYGQPWTHDELILAFDLYCRIPFRATKATNTEVQALARLLERSPAGVARKLGNFGAFDPALRLKNIVGLSHGGALDRQTWDEFHRDWAGLVEEAERIRASLNSRRSSPATDSVEELPTGPSERVVTAKQRLHQRFFRQAVLSSYGCSCCVTGLPVVETLVASHIIPWYYDERFRADPTNGLCLSATFDRLFDSGLMTFDAEARVCLSKKVRNCVEQSTTKLILAYDGRPLRQPTRFVPRSDCLEWHRNNVFHG